MRFITRFDIDTLMRQARDSKRKRAILRLHEHEEPVQRMMNALIPGTYVPPHKHENPDKVELFSIMVGRVACLQFDVQGAVTELVILEERGVVRVVEIAPRSYHTLIALEPSVVLEIIQGPYDPATHKRIAPWAPEEENPKASDYRMYLESIIHNWSA